MPSQEPIHLFVYGTLTDPEQVTALTGKQFKWVDATLSGFERVNSPLGYPYILPKFGTFVRGILLLSVDAVSLAELDAYEAEGDLYRRQGVVVEVADKPVPAMTYVGHGIHASAAPMPARQPAPGQRECRPEASTPARGRHAPCPDEH